MSLSRAGEKGKREHSLFVGVGVGIIVIVVIVEHGRLQGLQVGFCVDVPGEIDGPLSFVVSCVSARSIFNEEFDNIQLASLARAMQRGFLSKKKMNE